MSRVYIELTDGRTAVSVALEARVQAARQNAQLLEALQLARGWIMEARTMTALPSDATLASIRAAIAAAADGVTK